MGDTKVLGNAGEEIAASYLQQHGYTIRERQYRCKLGEIDIIAEYSGEIIFVEVKTRRSSSCGTPALAVNYYKKRKIIRAAQVYIQFNRLEDRNCRFDVLEVFAAKDGGWAVRALTNAFEVE